MTKTTTPIPFAPTNAYAINEAFLHYVWKTKNFPFNQILSTEGKPIKILDWGFHNHNAGPDFLDGKIEYNGVIWAGHIELHVRSSDWYKHHHQVDPAYDQVILHVVLEDDRPVTDIHLNPITTLELKDRIDPDLICQAQNLVLSKHRIPCAHVIGNLSTFWLNAWKERQLIEQLEYKIKKINHRLHQLHGDWEQVALELLFRSMGFHANGEALEELARHITYRSIRKVMHDKTTLQALLFGRAGLLLEDSKYDYPQLLKETYNFLKTKYAFPSRVFIKWNFKGARPPNFPTVRIAQLAEILFNSPSFLRRILEADNINQLRDLFIIDLPDFWKTHYVLNKRVDKAHIKMSKHSVDLLIINYCIPVLYAYGQEQRRDELMERAINFLYILPGEKNAVIKEFSKAGVISRCAGESQALLHTFRHYCSQKRCLECQVGNKAVRTKN